MHDDDVRVLLDTILDMLLYFISIIVDTHVLHIRLIYFLHATGSSPEMHSGSRGYIGERTKTQARSCGIRAS